MKLGDGEDELDPEENDNDDEEKDHE